MAADNIEKKAPGLNIKKIYMVFIWHGIFLSLTMSMIDFNTVFPALVTDLVESKIIFGLLYSIMLGVPLFFNIIFSHFMKRYQYKKKFLLIGIYLRSIAFLGMSTFTYFFGQKSPGLVILSFFFWITIFSLSGGFAGLAYSDIIGKLVPKGERGKLYAAKQLAGSLTAFLGGIIVTRIFSPGKIPFPANYALILFVGFMGLVVAAVAFWFFKEPPSRVKEEDREPLLEFFKKVPLILKNDLDFFRFIIIENMASFSLMILPFYMVYAKDVFAIDKSYIGRFLLFQVTGTIISNLLWGWISNKWGSRMVVRLCVLGGGIIPVMALLITPLGAGYYGLIFFLIGFLISGRRVGFDPYLLDIAPEDDRTVYLGIRGTLNFLVVLLPVLGGFFIDFLGYYFTFIFVTFVMALAFLLFGKKKASAFFKDKSSGVEYSKKDKKEE